MTIKSHYFYGHKVSDYGIENHRVDYRTLAQAFDCVLNNDIMSKTCEIGYWEQESGYIDNSDEIDELNGERDELTDEMESYQEQLDTLDEELDAARCNGQLEKAEMLCNARESLKELIAELEDKIAGIEDRIYDLENEYEPEIFQYYIVTSNGAEILKEANEIVFYNEELDMYVWGVTHWGTSWDYVLTDILISEES